MKIGDRDDGWEEMTHGGRGIQRRAEGKFPSAALSQFYASFPICLKWSPRILDSDRHADRHVWNVVQLVVYKAGEVARYEMHEPACGSASKVWRAEPCEHESAISLS